MLPADQQSKLGILLQFSQCGERGAHRFHAPRDDFQFSFRLLEDETPS
jgi:hypothetical protein